MSPRMLSGATQSTSCWEPRKARPCPKPEMRVPMTNGDGGSRKQEEEGVGDQPKGVVFAQGSRSAQ